MASAGIIMLHIPEVEAQRLKSLRNGFIIPQSYQATVPTSSILLGQYEGHSFCTYHNDPGMQCCLWWSYTRDAYTAKIAIFYNAGQQSMMMTPGEGNFGYTHRGAPVALYTLHCDPLTLGMDPASDIHAYMVQQLTEAQSAPHFTRFMVACKALQTLVHPPDQPMGYTGISIDGITPNPSKEHTERHHAIYTMQDPAVYAHTRYPRPRHPSTQWSVMHIAEHSPYEDHVHETTSHTISLTGLTKLKDLMGPWHHPYIMPADTVGAAAMEHTQCIPWLDAEILMPPHWPGYEALWDHPEVHSQHTWISLQRAVHHAMDVLRPHIAPYTHHTPSAE